MTFDKEQIETIENLAGLRYTPEQIALYLGVNEELFMSEFQNKSSNVRHHYDRGVLIAIADIDMALLNSAKGGNVTSIQQYLKILKDKTIHDFKKGIIEGH